MNTYNVEKDDAKNLFIILLYFGSFTSWIKEKNVTINTKQTTFITKFIS